MAKASDCGSEDRGFESHYPPHIIKAPHPGGFYYILENGTRRERPPLGAGKKCPVDTFSARGRVPLSTPYNKSTPIRGAFIISRRMGLEESDRPLGRGKSVRWTLFQLGGESHYPPHKQKSCRTSGGIFAYCSLFIIQHSLFTVGQDFLNEY